MTIPDWLRATLACPICKGPLSDPPPPEQLLPRPPGEGRGEGAACPGFIARCECAARGLAAYVRQAVEMLDAQPVEELARGAVLFPELALVLTSAAE